MKTDSRVSFSHRLTSNAMTTKEEHVVTTLKPRSSSVSASGEPARYFVTEDTALMYLLHTLELISFDSHVAVVSYSIAISHRLSVLSEGFMSKFS